MANFWDLNNTSIDLPYNFENFIWLLSQISKGENNFSHYDFAQWCDNFTIVFDDMEVS